MNCIFCGIVHKTIPATIVHEDAKCIAFQDIAPAAPHHYLIIPKSHLSTLNDLELEHQALIGHLILSAQHLAKTLGFAEAGYRLVFNCNADGGQAVDHIHLHLLGGRHLTWPPG